MTDLREAAQMALDWADNNGEAVFAVGGWEAVSALNKWSQPLRAALAQPEKTNQCGEVCERAKLCAVCTRGLAQPEQEPVTTLFGSLPVYDLQTKQKPVAWVETLENARPHCVTDLNYLSVAQHERGEHLKYIPLYIDPTPCKTCESLARTVMMDQTSHDTAPPQREWQGLTDMETSDLIWKSDYEPRKIARAIEAKLREKNHE